MHITSTHEFRVPADIFLSGWNAALQRPTRVRVLSDGLVGLPTGITVRPWRPPTSGPKVYSVFFSKEVPAPPGGTCDDNPSSPRTPVPVSSRPQPPELSEARGDRPYARIRPPADVIKLADRLFFLLQPPVETLVSSEDMTLPFTPFPYQWEGIAFLYPRVAAVLADEMGLGKTMQAITTMRMLLRSGDVRRILLICPKPLVSNWQREFAMWAEEIPIVTIEGPRERRRWQWQEVDAPLRLANYEVILRDQDLLLGDGMEFDLVVLDEAQRIKNRTSGTSEAVRQIRRRRSWALTGTPVENSVDDLLGIFEFVSPGYLSAAMPLRGLGKAAGEYILRRTKQQVLTDLPPKLVHDVHVGLGPAQQKSYESAENHGTIKLAAMGASMTIQHVFELVLRLKQICNFDPVHGESVKLERLLSDLEEIASSGQKAIVFSQWVETLQKIRNATKEYGPLEFHGRRTSAQREQALQQFREDPHAHLILMSYGAGSVGLNLQFASYVFLFDRWWNPAVEDQAINRAHRIGAAGPVTVTRFVTLNTIEERINAILEQKRELFETILSHADQAHRVGLSQAEIFGLFQLGKAA